MAKYDSIRKVPSKTILQYRQEHPQDSWREIGEHFGITAEGARQAYLRAQKKTKP